MMSTAQQYAKYNDVWMDLPDYKSSSAKYYLGDMFVQFDFRSAKESKIIFSRVDGGSLEHAFWSIVASAKFSPGDYSMSEFRCEQVSAFKVFDSTVLRELAKPRITLTFSEIVGFGVVPRPWDYCKSNPQTDIGLLVAGARSYQNKAVLAYHSPYFRSLLQGNSQYYQQEVKIDNIVAYRFLNLMDAMHGSLLFHTGNVELVLEDAKRFNIPIAIGRAEDFLCGPNNLNVNKKLILADTYNLGKLLGKVLANWTAEDAKAVAENADPSFKDLSSATMMAIFKASHNVKPK